MKLYSVILLLIFFSCTNRQEKNQSFETKRQVEILPLTDTTNNSSYRKLNDTIFIHREVSKDFYHAIYIDTNRHSKYYDWLTNFEFNKYDVQSYQESYEYLKEKFPKTYMKVNSTELPEDWIPVYLYKDNYYLYAPSDWGNAGKRIINDSAFVYWYMDGPLPIPLTSVKKEAQNKYILEISNLSKDSLEKQELTIFQIDPKTQLSVFKFSNKTGKTQYRLYIPKESASSFDMIVNYCENQKQLEFEFEEIDFKKLIKNSR